MPGAYIHFQIKKSKKMKNLILIYFLALILCSNVNAQRLLEWSIGDVEVTCVQDVPSQLCYPIQVTIDDEANSPSLAASTIRFYYDAGYLSAIDISNTANGYTTSGFQESNDVFADAFGFAGGGGRFVQFSLNPNTNNLLSLSNTPTEVLQACFTIIGSPSFPLCAAFVFDNGHCGAASGMASDDIGYQQGSEGLVGAYFLDGDTGAPVGADDEVVQFLWNTGQDCAVVDQNSVVGSTNTNGVCIQALCGQPSVVDLPAMNIGRLLLYSILFLSMLIFLFVRQMK